MAMAGYGGRDDAARGKLTDLWAKALVIDAGRGRRGVIITLDPVGIDRTFSQAVCESLGDEWRSEGVLKGPIDHDVPVLAVGGTKGELKAILFGYACHATVLSFNRWSGD